jgi:dUTP pyrophosphatase
VKLQFKKLHPDAKLPVRANPGDAGYDLSCIENVEIPAGDRLLIRTGLAVAVPEGYYGRIAPRSGLAVKLAVQTGAGVVDAGYRGELKVLLFNHSKDTLVTLEAGAKISQLILEAIITPEPEFVDELPETVRGAGGFGSTGV